MFNSHFNKNYTNIFFSLYHNRRLFQITFHQQVRKIYFQTNFAEVAEINKLQSELGRLISLEQIPESSFQGSLPRITMATEHGQLHVGVCARPFIILFVLKF